MKGPAVAECKADIRTTSNSTVVAPSGTLNGQVIEQKDRWLPIDCNWPICEKQTYYVYSKQLNGAVGTANNVEVQRKLYIVNGVSRNVDKIVQLMEL